MWNNFNLISVQTRWRSIWQNVYYRRLAIAIFLSFLLHLLFVGQFYIDVTSVQNKPSQIEARLVLPPPTLPRRTAEARPSLANKAPAKKIPPALKTHDEPEPTKADAPVLSDVTPETETGVANISESPLSEKSSVQFHPLEEAAASEENKGEVADVIVNENTYHYIETAFDVRTNIDEKVDSSPAGKAKIVYQRLADGEHYQLKSLIEAKGLAALVIPDLLQTSEGLLNHTGIQPQHYLYQFGHKANKTFSADFNWPQKQLTLHSAKGDQTLELVEGTQDLLSFMYQFMFVAPLQNMRLSITNGKKIGVYDYSFEGEETIATKMGNISTIHLMRMAAEGEKKTELWLALDYQYVPVKIRETEKQGKVYELLVTSLKTEMPASKPESSTP